MQNLKQYWPQYHPLRNTTLNLATYWMSVCYPLFSEPSRSVFHQPCGPSIQPVCPHFHYRDAKRDHVWHGLANFKVNDIHCSSLTHQASFLRERIQADRGTKFDLGKSKLAAPNHHLLFHTPGNSQRRPLWRICAIIFLETEVRLTSLSCSVSSLLQEDMTSAFFQSSGNLLW